MLAALGLLTGMALDHSILRSPPADAHGYHARVRADVRAIPYRIGDWVGYDVELPQAAVAKLQPNAMLSRRYRDVRSGREAGLLIVHCTDARDLLGHYPPVCYPASGWRLTSSAPRTWPTDAGGVHGSCYRFEREALGAQVSMTIANFMVLPGEGTVADMAAVNALAQDPQRKYLGAAQVQLLLDGDTDQATADTVFHELIGANAKVIQTIQAGPGSPRRRNDRGPLARSPYEQR